MKPTNLLIVGLCTAVLLLTGCQSVNTSNNSAATSITTTLTKRLDKVDENHATIEANQEFYVLDTYIIPFQQPYYILVRRQDNKRFSKNIADVLAVDYIKTRGCNQTLVRRSDLDKSTSDGNQHLIGVAC